MQFLTSLLAALSASTIVSALPSNPDFSAAVATRSETLPASGTVATIESPKPLLPKVVNYCNKFHKIVQGDNCFVVGQQYGVTLDQLRTWNGDIDETCSNLLLGFYACVGVPGRPSNALPNSIMNCDGWHTVKSGNRCIDITPLYGITLAQLSDWNPDINEACSNLVPNTSVCVKLL